MCLISIIIPTYNRAHLISETLDSIIVQSYNNWECIVVDDGSEDDTQTLLKEYLNRDLRFKYIKRPSNLPKGANACRNYGLELSRGDYVVFFDSDDLMTDNHLGVKLNAIKSGDFDFAVTKTNFFNYDAGNIALERNYNFRSEDISLYNYISQKLNWLTYDICIKSDIAKNIKFNERLHSGQEFNYFAKLLTFTTNATYCQEVITYRRRHQESIQGKIRKEKSLIMCQRFQAYWETFLDIKHKSSKAVRQNLIYKCYRILLNNSCNTKIDTLLFYKTLIREFSFKGLYYILKIL